MKIDTLICKFNKNADNFNFRGTLTAFQGANKFK